MNIEGLESSIKYLKLKNGDLKKKSKYLENKKTKYIIFLINTILAFITVNYLSLFIYNNIILDILFCGPLTITLLPTINTLNEIDKEIHEVKKEYKDLANSINLYEKRKKDLTEESEINTNIYYYSKKIQSSIKSNYNEYLEENSKNKEVRGKTYIKKYKKK